MFESVTIESAGKTDVPFVVICRYAFSAKLIRTSSMKLPRASSLSYCSFQYTTCISQQAR